jgi:hypothetical protein
MIWICKSTYSVNLSRVQLLTNPLATFTNPAKATSTAEPSSAAGNHGISTPHTLQN